MNENKNLARIKVGVITLNYNQNDYTIKCIESLLKSVNVDFKILLVDNGSSLQNYAELRQYLPNDDKLGILRLETNIGYVGGINSGLKVGLEERWDYFLIMNNDTLIDENAISELVISARHTNDTAIVTGKVFYYDQPDILQDIGQYCRNHSKLDYPLINKIEKDIGQYDDNLERDMIDDIFWLLPRKIVETIGFYSDYFYLYGEQNDYVFRAKMAGFNLRFCPNAYLWHKGSITTSDGKTGSPRVVYWASFATLKLSALHLTKEESKKFYVHWLTYVTLKRIYFFIIRKTTFKHLRAHFLAIKHFNHWNVIRYKDVGYNPF